MSNSRSQYFGKGKTSIFLNCIIVLLFYIFPSMFFAQTSIKGIWKIDQLIGIGDQNKYSLTVEQKRDFGYNDNLTLNQDGTFISRDGTGSPPRCMTGYNPCFTITSGSFLVVDDTHIRFILQDINYWGSCDNKKSKIELNQDLGIFYIHKDSTSIQLFKSNGILEDDKAIVIQYKAMTLYADMINSFNKDWKSYDFVWENTKGKNSEEVVKDCIDYRDKVDLSNYKLVYSKKEDYGHVILLRENENFKFVVYNEFKKKVSLAYPRLTE